MNSQITANEFRWMIVAGANRLEANKKEVDELNVFPVPDGDTGTNMSLTITSAAREVIKVGDDATIAEVSKALSSGALRGARGNSGVILSQLMRGLYRSLRGTENVDAAAFADAMRQGVETAYKAVMRPKEGTILTVARGMADAAIENAVSCESVADLLKVAIEKGEEVLEQTPEMLPVLKEAGVVDAGGKGLLYISKGMLASLTGEDTCHELLIEGQSQAAEAGAERVSKYRYQVSFVLHMTDTDKIVEPLRSYYSGIGDSIKGKTAPDTVEIALCTDDPGLALQKAIAYGPITDIIVENRRPDEVPHAKAAEKSAEPAAKTDDEAKIIDISAQENSPKTGTVQGAAAAVTAAVEAAAGAVANAAAGVAAAIKNTVSSVTGAVQPAEKPQERKQYGFAAVSMGDGLSVLLKELGADEIITGGQTMNPSTEDVLNAVRSINADVVYVLPNNKNIILAAQQAAELVDDKKVYVVHTRNVPQGISALLNFTGEPDPEKNLETMEEIIQETHTAMTTYAIRDTQLSRFDIHKDDILGMVDGELAEVGTDPDTVARRSADHLKEFQKSLYTVYYGQDSTEERANKLADYIREQNPDCEVEVQYGGQPIYHYILSVE